jgi:putative acetyltransferase
VIRDEAPGDAPAVRVVLEEAFETPLEARIVDALRSGCDDRLSLVAERDGGIVGHILFTPVVIEAASGPLRGYGLIPEGVARLRGAAAPFVLVIGHPGYYPRFGFEPPRGTGCAANGRKCPTRR